MGKDTGFMEYSRKNGETIAVSDRIKNFNEFHKTLRLEEQQKQAARCMDCGVPFCQAGKMISGMASGCPLHNLVPEINDCVYRGNLEQAYKRLSKTHAFPEFTSRVCPALCEAACTCGYGGDAVSTKENERTVIEYAYEHGLVGKKPEGPRTGKKIAVIGSGPSGLSTAYWLNFRGHDVTVYERSDRCGGLLRYGIPNMKLEKSVIDRRIKAMEESGIKFVTSCNIGVDVTKEQLLKEYDRVVLCCGSSKARDINAPGRDAEGIYFAVDFLSRVTKQLLDTDFKKFPYEMAQNKNVIIIGGGDTGNDCVGTSIRLGCKSVVQLEMMPCPPSERVASNPWPEWPKVLKTDYGQEEAIEVFGADPRRYQTTVKEFLKDKDGKLTGVKVVKLSPVKDKKTGRMNMEPVEGSEEILQADLVLIAAGFVGAEDYVVDAMQVAKSARGNVEANDSNYETSVPGIYAAGDMRRGQSLVVWAISEGRQVAKSVDQSLMGYTNL
ncbi:MAG: glutamate synthase subunit beta [Lachnospiraceae bacterium]|nr:glutamate synthase subunit beta [Lachnospiraceae bacterium]